MDRELENKFAVMVANLLQTEFCPDWDPKLLHGCMGIASEAGEILEKYSNSIEVGGVPFERTNMLIELSDLLHYMQMIMGTLNSSISEVKRLNSFLSMWFFDEAILARDCERLDPVLLRGFIRISARAGEFLNRYKKFLFYHGEPFTRDEILMELAKLLQSIQIILGKLDSSIEEVIAINMAKLGSRYPNGYSHDKAITHHRDKEAERMAVEVVVAKFALKRSVKKEDKGSGNGEEE